ncbi:MAG: DUF5615 family PIN-like protein [Treponema sp.]|jgi:predicted nuclease of predicted toxin-antitoxin system|nr:DUF5615 family PIN-like protein [Treponema sp.]
MKILIDMNLAVRWADMLSNRGIEAVHWTAVGEAAAPDRVIMAYARDRAYAILTKDLDFSAILAFTHDAKPSVIQIRAADSRPEKLLEPVFQAVSRFSADIEHSAIVTIDMQKPVFIFSPSPPENPDLDRDPRPNRHNPGRRPGSQGYNERENQGRMATSSRHKGRIEGATGEDRVRNIAHARFLLSGPI